MGNIKLLAALAYHLMGFSVIPVKPDKKPYIYWKKYQSIRASRDQIRKWWKIWPDANIGIVCGAVSGIDVVDVDSQKAWDELNGFLPGPFETPIAKTRRGYHVYLAYKEGFLTGGKLAKDIDFKTNRGIVIAPPSINEKGDSYSWIEGIKIVKKNFDDIPYTIYDIIDSISPGHSNNNKKNNSNKVYKEATDSKEYLKPQIATVGNSWQQIFMKKFPEGVRDDTLYHIAHHLFHGSMPVQEIKQFLMLINNYCCDPLDEKRKAEEKIRSVLNRAKHKEQNIAALARQWALATTGHWETTKGHLELQLATRKEKRAANEEWRRMKEDGLLEPYGQKRGCYRLVDKNCEEIDFLNADTEKVDLRFPFDLDKMVEIMPGNIIVVAGEPDAGKTAFLLNIIRQNMKAFKIHYFNSEMGKNELKKRLSLFDDIDLKNWTFDAWERSDNFADVIEPGKGIINIIDFLEVYKDFYEIGGKLNEIHKKLNGAIAIVALQKNKSNEVGLGGFRGLEKPRLYITMSRDNICKIVKAKNWTTSENPNNKQINYKIVNGCKLIQKGEWIKVMDTSQF